MTTQELNDEFENNRSKLRSFVFRLTANKADTDDIVQETYIKASAKLYTFKGASSLKTWIFSIAANLAKDDLRSKKRWSSDAMDLAKAETLRDPEKNLSQFLRINSTPTGIFETNERINFSITCIGKTLDVHQQVVILLKEVFGFKDA